MSELKKAGRHGVVYALGIILSKAVAFIMLPIYTRFLTPSDYGVLQLVTITLEVVSIVAGSRLAGGVFRFYFKAKTDEERRAVLTTAFGLLVACYSIAALLTALAAPAIAQAVFDDAGYARIIRVAAASLAFEGWLVVPFAYLRIRDRSSRFVAINTCKLMLQLGMNVWFVVHLRMAAEGVLLSAAIANLLIGGYLAAGLLREAGFTLSRGAAHDILRFGLPLVGTQVATFISTFGDRFFLQRAGGNDAVGLYGLAYDFGFLLVTLGFTPFNTVWEPLRFKMAERPDRDALYAKAFVYLNLLLITMAVGITLFVGDALRIMADPAFHGAAAIVPIVLVAYVLQSWQAFHNMGIMMVERTGWITTANWAAAAVAVAGYVLLIPRYLGYGAAIATVLAFGVREVIIYVVSQRLWPVAYEWARTCRLLALATAVGVAGSLVHEPSLWRSVALHAALFAVYVAGLWLLRVIPDQDRASLRAMLRSPGSVLAGQAGA